MRFKLGSNLKVKALMTCSSSGIRGRGTGTLLWTLVGAGRQFEGGRRRQALGEAGEEDADATMDCCDSRGAEHPATGKLNLVLELR